MPISSNRPDLVSGTAAALLACAPRIQERWTEQMRAAIKPAEQLAEPLLVNTLSELLQKLADALVSGVHTELASNTNLGEEHGQERARFTSFSIDQVVLEYQLLRQAAVTTLEEELDARLSTTDRATIEAFTNELVRNAVRSYSTVQKQRMDMFAATLSHDLRNPLTAARLAIDGLLRHPGQADVPRLLARARDNIDRVDRMVQDLLDASQIRAGQLYAVKLAECDVMELVSSTVDGMRALHGDRFVLSGRIAVTAHWDCNALRRALENLLGNAVKYGSRDTPVTVQVRQPDTRVSIDVHNEGSFIHASDIQRLFTAYQRTREVRRGDKPGWGLGLTLVKGVAEAHGGAVLVESSPERGTTFTLTLPIDGSVVDADRPG